MQLYLKQLDLLSDR